MHRFVSSSLCVLALASAPSIVRASGPVERLVQVFVEPDDPMHVVLRWSYASEGFLYSRDGGKTFAAMCSNAIDPLANPHDRIARISSQRLPTAAAAALDADGKIVIGALGDTWSDDGNGCSWQRALMGEWMNSLRLDPRNPRELLAVTTTQNSDGTVARAALKRRDAAGAWTEVGPLLPDQAMLRAYGGDLLTWSRDASTVLYASANVAVGPLTVLEKRQLFRSDDNGASWTRTAELPAEQQEDFVLLAVDPGNADRVLAANSRDSAADTLLLSEDGAKTFREYGQFREITGVTFAPDGRVFIGDAGDSTSNTALGGLFTAPSVGAALTQIAGTQFIDCVDWNPVDSKLRICMRERYGEMDPSSGAFTEYARMSAIDKQLSCPGVDMTETCKAQLNAGASWCCVGHYPYTPFCGDYDVVIGGLERVYCGLAARQTDADAGYASDAGSLAPADSGTPAGNDAGPSAGNQDDGCALAAGRASSGWLDALTPMLLALWMRRRARFKPKR